MYRMRLAPCPIVFFVVLALTTLLAGCAAQHTNTSFPRTRQSINPDKTTLSHNKALEYFIRGLSADRQNAPIVALTYYQQALDLDPYSLILRQLLVSRYNALGKYQQSISIARNSKRDEKLTDAEKRLLASVYIQMQNWQKAAELYIALTTPAASELYTLGKYFEAIKNIPKAIKSYQKAFELDTQLGDAGVKAAQLSVALKEFNTADTLYQRLALLYPDKALPNSGRGNVALQKGDTASAIKNFSDALAKDSLDETALRSLAQLELAQDSFTLAIPRYRSLVSINSLYTRPLSMLFYYNRQYDSAQLLFSKILSQNPNDPEIHLYLGYTLAALRDTAPAFSEAYKALALEPKYADAWEFIVGMLRSQNRLDSALAVAKSFAQDSITDPRAWALVGRTHMTRREFAKATVAFKRSFALDTSRTGILFDLGSAQERSGLYKEASRSFQKVLDRAPRSAATANYLGYMWAEQDTMLDSAESLIKIALLEEPESGAYLDSYAWVLYKKNNYTEALLYAQKASAVLKDDAVVFEHLGDILAAQKETQKAIDAYEKALALKPDNVELLKAKILKLIGTTP